MITTNLIFIVVILLIALSRLLTNYYSGFNTVLFLLIWLPTELRFEPGGAFPAFTIHRLLLMLLVVFWLANWPRVNPLQRFPLIALLCAMALFQFISASFSIQPIVSFKSSLSLTCEMILLYLIAATSMTSEEQVMDALRAIIMGLSIVAALTFLEYFTQFNFVDKFLAPNRRIDASFEDLQSTYPHRILLGYAMALGWVLTFGRFLRTRVTWIFLLYSSSFLAACYLAMSRGPWLGSLIGVTILLLIGTAHIRKNLAKMVIVVLFCLISLTYVRLTIVGLAEATLDPTSQKGKSYEHRWKLWSVAYNEISKSPARLLFGYGGNSTNLIDLGRYLEEGTTTDAGFTSWDNQFASDLMEYGFVGFVVICCVLIAVFRRAWRLCRAATGAFRQLSASLLAFVGVFVFAMTNVKIFAPQLNYLFWVVVSIVVVLERQWFAKESVPFLDRSQPKSA